jgi:valyl-tRNA synthetase
VANTSELDRDRLQRNGTFLQRLSKSASIIPIDNHDAETASLMALFGELEVRVPMAGLVDVTAELTRLDKEIAKAEAEKARLNGKLTNAKFIERAPADIVAAERQKLTQVDAALKVLQQQRRQIEELRSA